MVSLKLRDRVAVSLESTIDDIGSRVHEVWHDWLVLGTVPWHVSGLSHSVPIAGPVVLMVYWVLPNSPLEMGIWNRWVLRKDSSQVPPKQVWVVVQGSLVDEVIVHGDWSLVSEASANTVTHEEVQVSPCEPASHIEVLNWKLSDSEQSQHASDLTSGGVVGPVEVRFASRSGDEIVKLVSWEPRGEDIELLLGLWGPGRQPLFDFVSRNTETDEVVVLDVVCNLVVHHSSLSIIESVLKVRG